MSDDVEIELENIMGKSTKDRLAEARALEHYLIVSLQGVNSSSADGVSISRNLEAVRKYIAELQVQLSRECGDVKSIMQMRVSW